MRTGLSGSLYKNIGAVSFVGLVRYLIVCVMIGCIARGGVGLGGVLCLQRYSGAQLEGTGGDNALVEGHARAVAK